MRRKPSGQSRNIYIYMKSWALVSVGSRSVCMSVDLMLRITAHVGRTHVVAALRSRAFPNISSEYFEYIRSLRFVADPDQFSND